MSERDVALWCDHGHAAREVRRLPVGGDGAVLVCRAHYLREAVSQRCQGVKPPAWQELEVYREE